MIDWKEGLPLCAGWYVASVKRNPVWRRHFDPTTPQWSAPIHEDDFDDLERRLRTQRTPAEDDGRGINWALLPDFVQRVVDAQIEAARKMPPVSFADLDMRDRHRQRSCECARGVCVASEGGLARGRVSIISDLVCRAATVREPVAVESDPDGIDAHTPGAKLDSGKPLPWLCIGGFSRALAAVSEVTTIGARKYTPNGWAKVADGSARYMEAFGRHTLELGAGKVLDSDTGCLHKAQMIWNLLASLELDLRDGAGR